MGQENEGRLRFGELRPKTFEEAIRRLPDIWHPDYRRDRSIQYLVALRETLELTIANWSKENPLSLERRMVPLTEEDVTLMERFSFRGGRSWEFDNKKLPREAEWSSVFNDLYRDWEIGFLIPGPTQDGIGPLIYVKTATYQEEWRQWEIEICIGLVTKEESKELVNHLADYRVLDQEFDYFFKG